MNYTEALTYIHSLSNNFKPTLERINKLLFFLGNPQNEIKAVHIAGTNGKGSVASIVSEVLISKGYKVGLYTSPFIIDFRERIKLNGYMISEADLTKYCMLVKETVENHGLTIGEFEFITAIAFLYFRDINCDYCVLETGLGGRYDATNTANSVISAITKISLDHTNILGSNLKEIAFEKSGIIKNNVQIITCNQSSDAMQVLEETTKCKNTELILADVKIAEKVNISKSGTSFSYKGVDYSINLLGAHQIENTVIAIEILNNLLGDFTNSKKQYDFPKINHPARLEIVSDNPLTFIDGAHNPDGARVLSEFLNEVNFKGTVIFGAMKDKDVEQVLKTLSTVTSKIITVTAGNMPRALKAEQLLNTAKKYFKSCIAAKSYSEALELTSGEPRIICGSLYLAADLRAKLLQKK